MYFLVLLGSLAQDPRAGGGNTVQHLFQGYGCGRSVRLVVIAVLLDFITNVVLLWRINLPFALFARQHNVSDNPQHQFVARWPLDYGKMMEGYIYRTEVSVV